MKGVANSSPDSNFPFRRKWEWVSNLSLSPSVQTFSISKSRELITWCNFSSDKGNLFSQLFIYSLSFTENFPRGQPCAGLSRDNGELSVQLSRRECCGSRDETNTCGVAVLTLITSCRGAGRGPEGRCLKYKHQVRILSLGDLKLGKRKKTNSQTLFSIIWYIISIYTITCTHACMHLHTLDR